MGTHTGTGTGGTVTSIDDAGIGTNSTDSSIDDAGIGTDSTDVSHDTVTDYTLALKMTVNTL